MKHEFTCGACGSHEFYLDMEGIFQIKKCISCEQAASITNPTEVEVSVNEHTTIADIAIKYLIGRFALLNGKRERIELAWKSSGSRMSITIRTESGQQKRLYLPSTIELIPMEN